MKKKITGYVKHPLISGSVVIFSGTLLANLFNYFYNIYMNHNLSVANFGTLTSLIAIVSLFSFATDSFVPTVVHFAASYFAREEYDMVRGLFFKFTKFTFFLGIFSCFVFIIFSRQLSYFFNISEKSLVILIGIIVMTNIVFIVNKSMIQAKLAFTFLSLITLVGSMLKFFIGALLVMVHFNVYGALIGFILSFGVQYFLSFLPLKNVLRGKSSSNVIGTKKIISYGAPAALSLVGVTFFISTDLIMVKHFFNPQSAGLYAGLALVGKVIYFFSAPIGMVMFPLIVQKHSNNEDYKNIFKLSILLVLLPSVCLTIFYLLFPDFTISFFLKYKQYVSIKPYLGIYAIYISLYSVLLILTNFFLSIKKTRVYIPIIIGSIVQATGLWFFHKDFWQVITISLISLAIPLCVLFAYYLRLHTVIPSSFRRIYTWLS